MSTKQILIVDLDHNLRVSLRRALEDSGHTVFSATNEKDALNILEVMDSLPTLIIIAAEKEGSSFLSFASNLSKSARYQAIPVAQIGTTDLAPISETASALQLSDVEKILHWLEAQD